MIKKNWSFYYYYQKDVRFSFKKCLHNIMFSKILFCIKLFFWSKELFFRSKELFFRSKELFFQSKELFFRSKELFFRSIKLFFYLSTLNKKKSEQRIIFSEHKIIFTEYFICIKLRKPHIFLVMVINYKTIRQWMWNALDDNYVKQNRGSITRS